MFFKKQALTILGTLRHLLSHGITTSLAVTIAFSLPTAARYILYQWWPRVESDGRLLLLTEVLLASALLLIFNLARMAWNNRSLVVNARLAALVYAARNGQGWLSHWRARIRMKLLPSARDVFVLTVTGYDTFVSNKSLLRDIMENAYEIRVFLVNPNGAGFQKRVESLPLDAADGALKREIQETIACLQRLRKTGKKVTLRFYDQDPLWNIIVVGDHVWVQHCHSGLEVKDQPAYVFALQESNPRLGLFVPFYMQFLNQWNDPQHPYYDFDSRDLVYRDETRGEIRRVQLEGGLRDTKPEDAGRAEEPTLHQACRLLYAEAH